MFQIRIHGRGGQGVVTAAEILSIAGFHERLYAQAFPSFGSERMGAPVMAFCRLHDRPIRRREPVMRPDALIVQDPTLLHQVDLFSGLADDGYVLINCSKPLEALGIDEVLGRLAASRVHAIPATDIARREIGRPLPNVPLLGGFAAVTGRLSLGAIQAGIGEKFTGEIGEANGRAAAAAYEHARQEMEKGAARC